MSTNDTLATDNPAILLGRIKLNFPEISWNNHAFINAGWDHEVIQLDDKYIFRFPKSPEYLSKLRDEIELLAYLGKRLETIIPQYLFIPQDYSFGGYSMIEGKSLEPELLKGIMNEPDLIAKGIATFLSELHALNIEELTKFNVTTKLDFAGYGDVAVEAEKYLKPNLAPDHYKQIHTMLDKIEIAKRSLQPACLIHGDLAPKHIIWKQKTKTIGLIDFSDRSISDPAYDLAELYSYGEAFVDKVYSLYESPYKNDLFLLRAKAYMQAIGIHSLVNAYRTDKIPLKEAEKLLSIGLTL